MLIVPLSGRLSLRNPPVVTIAVILINCFIFFFIQSGDGRIYEQASNYYLKSGLALIETKAHERYQEHEAVIELSPAELENHPYPQDELMSRMDLMQQDREFVTRLEQEQVITPGNEIYPSWKDKRDHFDAILSKTTIMAHGFRPAFGSMDTALTYMFLHGGFMHLLGNMVFLWLAGCVIELAWGRLVYLVFYILGGLFAVGLFCLAYLGSTAPLVGASGAIAALMGGYAVLYGRRKIKVFYSLGFYFNYTMVPGFVILGLWLGNEIFQLMLGSQSQVAYVAHIGGFSGGALMAFVNQKLFGKPDSKVFDPEPKDAVAALLDDGLKRVEVLDMSGARPIFEQVLLIDSNNRTALTQLFHIDKMGGSPEKLHTSARRLLFSLIRDKQAHNEVKEIYREYIRKAVNPGLPSGLLFSTVSYFASTGHVEEAEKIIGMLLSKSPDLPKIPGGLLHLARACLKSGLKDKARSYLQIICIRYPLSGECKAAGRILDDLDS